MTNHNINTRQLDLVVNLEHIADNYRYIERQLAPSARMSACVKADCYGLGVSKIAPVFFGLGCRDFFVARLNEAIVLKNTLHPSARIYIFDGLRSAQDAEICKQHSFIPVLNTIEQTHYVLPDQPVALHFDTGMNRLGLSAQDIPNIPDLNIQLILSHAASADNLSSTQTAQQFEAFQHIRTAFPNVECSFANSAALLNSSDYHCDLARPGLALYGVHPLSEQKNISHKQQNIKNPLSLYAPILQIREIPAGDSVGYNATFTAPCNITAAIIGIGYADGLPISLSNSGAFYFNGKRCPILGRVSMDLTIIDISKINPVSQTEDLVEILGSHQSVTQLAQDAGTIPYEIMTRLGNMTEKCYVNGNHLIGE